MLMVWEGICETRLIHPIMFLFSHISRVHDLHNLIVLLVPKQGYRGSTYWE